MEIFLQRGPDAGAGADDSTSALGRRIRPLGPTTHRPSPRHPRRLRRHRGPTSVEPRGPCTQTRVLERGSDMVLAAHVTRSSAEGRHRDRRSNGRTASRSGSFAAVPHVVETSCWRRCRRAGIGSIPASSAPICGGSVSGGATRWRVLGKHRRPILDAIRPRPNDAPSRTAGETASSGRRAVRPVSGIAANGGGRLIALDRPAEVAGGARPMESASRVGGRF